MHETTDSQTCVRFVQVIDLKYSTRHTLKNVQNFELYIGEILGLKYVASRDVCALSLFFVREILNLI